MKQTVNFTFVKALKAKRDINIFIADVKRIYKLDRKILPSIPSFENKIKTSETTDLEDNVEEISLI